MLESREPWPKPEDILPSARAEQFVQTEWATCWDDYAAAFEYAAERLVALAARGALGANVDQIGLAVVFLERHFLELTLKTALTRFSGTAPRAHRLLRLWDELISAARDHNIVLEDAALARQAVALVGALDPDSTVFRCPEK